MSRRVILGMAAGAMLVGASGSVFAAEKAVAPRVMAAPGDAGTASDDDCKDEQGNTKDEKRCKTGAIVPAGGGSTTGVGAATGGGSFLGGVGTAGVVAGVAAVGTAGLLIAGSDDKTPASP